MRAAATNEDNSLKHVSRNGKIASTRCASFTATCYEAGDNAAALAAYETALKATPNRYRGVLGVARAATATGDDEGRRALREADRPRRIERNVKRPEVQEAKAFLASK